MARQKEFKDATHLGIIVDRDVFEKMRKLAKKLNMSQSEAVREAIGKWIKIAQ